jgi:ribosomal protein L40E
MIAASDPNLIVGGFGLGLLALAAFWRLIVWVREAPRTPDPWDAEVEQKLQEPEAREICHRCMTPQEPDAWFCKHCGSAVGPYNNLMPFLSVFSEGEVLRNGVSGRFRNRPLIMIGYVLITFRFFLYFVNGSSPAVLGIFLFFTLVYWASVLLNVKRPSDRQEPADAHDSQPS